MTGHLRKVVLSLCFLLLAGCGKAALTKIDISASSEVQTIYKVGKPISHAQKKHLVMVVPTSSTFKPRQRLEFLVRVLNQSDAPVLVSEDDFTIATERYGVAPVMTADELALEARQTELDAETSHAFAQMAIGLTAFHASQSYRSGEIYTPGGSWSYQESSTDPAKGIAAGALLSASADRQLEKALSSSDRMLQKLDSYFAKTTLAPDEAAVGRILINRIDTRLVSEFTLNIDVDGETYAFPYTLTRIDKRSAPDRSKEAGHLFDQCMKSSAAWQAAKRESCGSTYLCVEHRRAQVCKEHVRRRLNPGTPTQAARNEDVSRTSDAAPESAQEALPLPVSELTKVVEGAQESSSTQIAIPAPAGTTNPTPVEPAPAESLVVAP